MEFDIDFRDAKKSIEGGYAVSKEILGFLESWVEAQDQTGNKAVRVKLISHQATFASMLISTLFSSIVSTLHIELSPDTAQEWIILTAQGMSEGVQELLPGVTVQVQVVIQEDDK